ncbi:hypothetical protein BJY16_001769 [Actinoplanes octamycinicus]|uniref:Uncharacterized protein n=1 Tax=Actinoplanes octamycinicus TaxID=135948 RepID=A0A7W7GU21_9ACTN|nr:hypothetical protein [Actinoplanes octamycinicus]MBB4738310.1 hypothetical protein [Actinoplanes octamycinicus]GIE57427.1 hypothetical protein Aoc01nite_28290 [Actinoplanes octamycinicus]
MNAKPVWILVVLLAALLSATVAMWISSAEGKPLSGIAAAGGATFIAVFGAGVGLVIALG